MTPTEALRLLDDTTFANSSARSKVNAAFSCGEVFTMVRNAIVDIQKRGEGPLDRIMEKQVHQAIRNQRRPRGFSEN